MAGPRHRLALAVLALCAALGGALQPPPLAKRVAPTNFLRRLLPPWLYDASSRDGVSSKWRAAAAALHLVRAARAARPPAPASD